MNNVKFAKNNEFQLTEKKTELHIILHILDGNTLDFVLSQDKYLETALHSKTS